MNSDSEEISIELHSNGTAMATAAAAACGGGAKAIQSFGLHWPTWDDWGKGFIHMAIPQIPLTTMNSVIAVCKLSDDLFPNTDEKHKATPRRVASSVGLMNLLMCLLGGFPMCHGAGGLAGQYRFGGRTGASVERTSNCNTNANFSIFILKMQEEWRITPEK